MTGLRIPEVCDVVWGPTPPPPPSASVLFLFSYAYFVPVTCVGGSLLLFVCYVCQ